MSPTINSTDTISMKKLFDRPAATVINYNTDFRSKFIEGHHADNHFYRPLLPSYMPCQWQNCSGTSYSFCKRINSDLSSEVIFSIPSLPYILCISVGSTCKSYNSHTFSL